ncbi:hypothetical protein SAMN02927900_01903 [Rhizobium mongolense subsp. loessense]|uniref:Uncharacterized protein n=1 Tax=Rhizobium mongolense subsp. loessense TaxID=158890 RepID=A0A1G4QVA1_9HYPH|nr:hypothetical protein [Rhizobium mongolense]SCW48546.1 hypothetical protein SAMN02927900_01903 [Rhizobium mongolense subsp. loessense]
MRDEDEDQGRDYLEEHLDRRRHAISDCVIGLALFAFSILAMAIGLDSAPAHTAPASSRPLLAFVIAMPATPCIDDRMPAGGSSQAMRLRHVLDRNIDTTLTLRKGSS